jgi:hypothetical protein
MNQYFQDNLQAIIRANPVLGANLFSIKEIENFDIYFDENNPNNINIIDKKDFLPMYETKPIDEIQNQLKELKSCAFYPYLYFYGVGNGVLLKALLENPEHKRIVVIEPEIEILYIALHFNDFAKDIANNRVVFLSSEDVTFRSMQKFFTHHEKVYLRSYQLNTASDYYLSSKFKDDIIRVNKCTLDAMNHCVLVLGNDSTDALLGIEQHITNVERLVKTPTLVDLIKKAKNTELAVIVSTGPSLIKQLPLLKKIADHVTIISVDASMPILAKHGIKADIVTSIERVPNTSKFFINTPKEYQEDVIFALTSIQDKAVFENIKAGTQQISMRPFGFNRYFGFHDWGYLGIGMSAANFAYELAFQSRFKRVVLIGQDLAYGDDGTSHSKGHTFGESELKTRNDDKYVTAYGGNGQVRTSLVWDLFRSFFELDISNSKDDIEAINATEGGARIEGSIEMPFSQVVDKYVDFSKKKNIIKLTPQTQESIDKNIVIARDRVDNMLEYATKIKDEVVKLFEDVSKKIKYYDKISARKNLKKVNYNDLNMLVLRLDKIKAYFDTEEFATVFTDATQAFIFHQEIDLATIQTRPAFTEKDRKLKLVDWIYAHQYWLFSLAGSMQAMIDIILYGIDESLCKDFFERMVKKYSKAEDSEEFMYAKYKFIIKKRLWNGPDTAPQSCLMYMMNNLARYYSYKELNSIIKNDFFIKNSNLINFSRPDELLEARNMLMDILAPLQKKVIKDSIDTDKKSILLFVTDHKEVGNDDVSIDSFMKNRYNLILDLLDSDKYNIITAIHRPLNKESIRELDTGDIYTIHSLQPNTLSFDEENSPFMLGWDLIKDIDFVDLIITMDVENPLDVTGSWRTGTEYMNIKKFIFPENVDVLYISKDNYKTEIKNSLEKL